MSSLAFDPNYATSGRFYLITGEAVPNPSTPHYSAPQNDTSSAFDSLLVEYRVDANDPDQADADSRRELLRVHQAIRSHNLDDLTFGHDGLLYVSVGDGGLTREGSPTQYQTTAQQTTNPFGSILRIDPSTIGPNGRYTIPSDNPFFDPNDPGAGLGGNAPEIFAWGVRNPWRISTDRTSGAIYTGNNGDSTIEMVQRVENGRNYGWALKEGSFLWDPITGNASVDPSPDPNLTPPLAEYDHNGTAQAFGSVIGGFVYRGSEIPPLVGHYLFNDHVAGEMVAMDPNTGALELVAIDPGAAQLQTFQDISWGEDEDGELYMGRLNGELLKLLPILLCGDLDGDRSRAAPDEALLRAHLAEAAGSLSPSQLARCSVIDGPTSCNVLDWAVLHRAGAGLAPGAAQVCQAILES